MTIDKEGRSSSPVHLHLDDSTPVHVHLKKPKKPMSVRVETHGEAKDKKAATSNLKRAGATASARSKSPVRQPWYPPPGKTRVAQKYAWQGPSHRLEVTSDDAKVIGHTIDMDTEDEDQERHRMRKYEKTIDSLMNEVGTLKNEVELQRSQQELERSRQYMEEQTEELEEYRRELQATEIENRLLRRSVEDSSTFERDRLQAERDVLMKKLVEVELDGQAASKQVSSLRDMIRRLREEKRLSSSDAVMLSKQRELLLDRLADFEETNRALRGLLRERHEEEGVSVRLAEQRDVLLRKLAETEDRVQELRKENLERERRLVDLSMQADAQKEENVAINSLQSSLEATRGHLQKQLRQKEADCNRMAVQIRSLESQLAQERIEVDHLQQLLNTAKEKADHDKEALKKATRVQKQRASKSEDALEQINAQMLEKDQQISELQAELNAFRSQLQKTDKEKSHSSSENLSLKARVAELESMMSRIKEDSRIQIDQQNRLAQEKSSEASQYRLENDRLMVTVGTLEDKLATTDAEMGQLRANLRQYENLVEEYRGQMNKSRREVDDTVIQLEEAKRESKRIAVESESELEKVKYRLQERLKELEPIPELLQTTELKLQDAKEKVLMYEKRNLENTRLIADLTNKVERQNEQLDTYRSKSNSESDRNRSLEARIENVEKKLTDTEKQNRDLLLTNAKQEEAIHQANLRLDEKVHEVAGLQRQLDAVMLESRRITEQARDKVACKERTSASRLSDVEQQLSTLRSENARMKREKDEAERRFNSRLYDLKDRLEQSHSTNRSLQNYVQFLKSSYASTFNDASFLNSPVRGASEGGGFL